jgi:hypothetical protein
MAAPDLIMLGKCVRECLIKHQRGYNLPLSKVDTNWRPWNEEYGGYWKVGKHWRAEVLP